MDRFIYKKALGVTALSASFSEFQYKKHSHEEYAVGVTLRGIQEYNLEGSRQASYAGGVMLFSPEQVHDGMSREKSGIDYVMLYIPADLFLELTGNQEIQRFASPILYNRYLEQHILTLIQAVFAQEEEALCSELLLTLADNFSKKAASKPFGKQERLIKKAREMLHSDLDRVLKLETISAEIGMSKYQFIRAFKSSTGISPYQFHLNAKVEKAKQIIEKSRDIYLAVAECGFVDLSHFNRHFKGRYGVTAFDYLSNIS